MKHIVAWFDDGEGVGEVLALVRYCSAGNDEAQALAPGRGTPGGTQNELRPP